MKTNMNIRPIAKISFAAVALFTTFTAVNAVEAAAAFESLDNTAARTEETLKYKAPEFAEAYIVSNSDIIAAAEELETVYAHMDETIRYEAPVVSDDVEAYEVEAALENLERFLLAQEESIKF